MHELYPTERDRRGHTHSYKADVGATTYCRGSILAQSYLCMAGVARRHIYGPSVLGADCRCLLGTLKASAVYDDAADQVIKTYQRTLDKATGLNRHAWDETCEMFWADSITGLSKHCWGRAQGWFTMALVEILDRLPQKSSSPSRSYRHT